MPWRIEIKPRKVKGCPIHCGHGYKFLGQKLYHKKTRKSNTTILGIFTHQMGLVCTSQDLGAMDGTTTKRVPGVAGTTVAEAGMAAETLEVI